MFQLSQLAPVLLVYFCLTFELRQRRLLRDRQTGHGQAFFYEG
jgi:hypothetical protein